VKTIDPGDEFLAVVSRIEAERTDARPLIEDLRRSGELLWERELPESWRTAGFAMELLTSASDVLEEDPRKSLVLAQLALTVVTSIPEGTYARPLQAQLAGSAWKEIGTSHRYRSRYDAALRAYDAAQRCFESEASLSHDVAILDLNRAIVLSDWGRNEEAGTLLESAVPILREFDDRRRVVQAQVIAGNIRQRQGRFAEARSIYESALRDLDPDDLHTGAVLHLNLGRAETEIGDFHAAALHLQRARAVFSELSMPAEVARTQWALASALMRAGDFDRAVPILQRTRADFLDRSMPEEAGLAGLDLVETMIATSHPAEARSLTERILEEFRSAELNARAITALAYLRDLLPSARQSGLAVRHVRNYIEQLRHEPSRVFIPLPE